MIPTRTVIPTSRRIVFPSAPHEQTFADISPTLSIIHEALMYTRDSAGAVFLICLRSCSCFPRYHSVLHIELAHKPPLRVGPRFGSPKQIDKLISFCQCRFIYRTPVTKESSESCNYPATYERALLKTCFGLGCWRKLSGCGTSVCYVHEFAE